MPPPQSSFVRHAVHAGTVEVPVCDPSDVVPFVCEGPTIPPSPPNVSEVPAAHPAVHPNAPATVRDITSSTIHRVELFMLVERCRHYDVLIAKV
jgi:hypothetical protein